MGIILGGKDKGENVKMKQQERIHKIIKNDSVSTGILLVYPEFYRAEKLLVNNNPITGLCYYKTQIASKKLYGNRTK